MAVFIISFFLAFRHTVTPFTVHVFRKVHVIDAQYTYLLSSRSRTSIAARQTRISPFNVRRSVHIKRI